MAHQIQPGQDPQEFINSVPVLRFIGGPRDGETMLHAGDLPIRSMRQKQQSLSGVWVVEEYKTDPDDPTMLRLMYVGRKLVG